VRLLLYFVGLPLERGLLQKSDQSFLYANTSAHLVGRTRPARCDRNPLRGGRTAQGFWVPHCGSSRASAGQLKQVVTEAGFPTPEMQLSMLALRT
jgi:hypothetical protein